MLNKNTVDAYHKITAPEGLRERIEASLQAAEATKKKHGLKQVWMPAVTVFAAAAVCLAVWAGGADIYRQNTDEGAAVMKLSEQQECDERSAVTQASGQQGVLLMLDSGEVLSRSQTEIDVYTGDTADLNALLVRSYGVAEAKVEFENGETPSTAATAPSDFDQAITEADQGSVQAAVFRVMVTEPVTFSADGEILSIYDADRMLWSEPCSELVMETDGELCVLLTLMGDKEVFCIEMSSADGQSVIKIVHDKTAGHYMAACQKIAGE